jgi:hypothetical protein
MLNVYVVQRNNTLTRKRVLDQHTEMIHKDLLPPFVFQPDKKCGECSNSAQWYICGQSQNKGITNGVTPGLKCNLCKERFLLDYLSPNWEQPPHQWQSYYLMELLS